MKRLISVVLALTLLFGGALAVSAGYPDPGPGRTNIFMQNIGVNDATVGLVFTTESTGVQAWTYDAGGVIKPKASKYVLYSQFGVSDGWAGAVEVSATEPLAAIVNMFWDAPSGVKTAATYTGIGDPAQDVYVPLLAVRDNLQTTRITVQNTEDAVASITISFFDRNGGAGGTKNDTIPAKSEKTYYLESVTEMNLSATNGLGSAKIHSDKKIAAVATTHTPDASEAYSAMSAGDTTLWVPGVFRKQFPNGQWNYNATVIQNLGTQAANVHIQFISMSNAVSYEMDDTINPKAAAGYNTFYQGTQNAAKFEAMKTALGAGWQGTMKIVSTNGQPLAGVSFCYAMGSGFKDFSAYNAIRDVDATSKALSFPAVYRKGSGSSWTQWSTCLIQNIGSAGSLLVEVYGTDGTKKSEATVQIPANGSVRLNLYNGLELPQSVLTAVGGTFSGGMYITPSTGVKIIGIGLLFWPADGRASGYDGFPVP